MVGYEGRLLDGYFFDYDNGFTAAHRWDAWGCISETSNFLNWETQHFNNNPLNGIEFYNNENGFAVGANGLILSTIDGGINWEDGQSGIGTELYRIDCVDEAVCYSVGQNGEILKYLMIPEGILGDVNQDENLDILDIVRIVNIILNTPPEPTWYELWASDFNQDGNINVLDVIGLLNVIVG